MKKISIILVILIIFNLIIASFDGIGASFAKESLKDLQGGADPSSTSDVMNGEATVKPSGVAARKESITGPPTAGGAIAGILAVLVNSLPTTVNSLLAVVVTKNNTDTSVNRFTIQDLVNNKYDFFNIDFFEGDKRTITTTEEVIVSGKTQMKESTRTENINKDNANYKLKESVASWYASIQRLAIIISLLVLIYVGIRMALSTVASEEAKYKKMFADWVVSFILIFVLHYIVIIAINVSSGIASIIPVQSFNLENDIIGINSTSGIMGEVRKGKGWDIVWPCIMYIAIVYYQVKFFFLYSKRVLSTAFLIIIAPLITITYSIDKIGDGEAQAFTLWLKEILVNIFIQPIHLILYVVFIGTAAEIAKVAPMFAIFFFMALSRGEKIIKNIFNIRGLSSINSMGGKGQK